VPSQTIVLSSTVLYNKFVFFFIKNKSSYFMIDIKYKRLNFEAFIGMI
jgi:hypothetical protein